MFLPSPLLFAASTSKIEDVDEEYKSPREEITSEHSSSTAHGDKIDESG